MEFERYDDGVPSWVDLSSPDLEKSKAFYSALFGWECPEGPPEAGGYSVCLLGGKTVAGLGPQMNPDFPPAWMTYVNVTDADDAIAKVGANGGTVFVPPMDVMDVGRMAIFADPLGAVIGLWQPKTHVGRAGGQRAQHVLLERADHDGHRGLQDLLQGGLRLGHRGHGGDTGSPPAYSEWKLAGKSVGGMMPKRPDMPADMPPNWGVYFAVDDADAAVAKVQELGGAVFMGPMDIEPGRMAVVADNVGAVFNILKLKS